MKYIAISDLHGHVEAFLTALRKVKFQPNSSQQTLIICGDIVNNGHEYKKIYDYIMPCKNVVYIKGNHEDRLLKLVKDHKAGVLDYKHLTTNQIKSLNSIKNIMAISIDNPKLTLDLFAESKYFKYINEALDYYETKNYIFVHGWVPTSNYDWGGRILSNWRKANEMYWIRARRTKLDAIKTGDVYKSVDGKTVVFGHLGYNMVSQLLNGKPSTDILYGNGWIDIDPRIQLTGEFKPLIIDDKPL